MKLNAPTQSVWIIAVVAGCLGLAGHFVGIPYVSGHECWLISVGFVLLFLTTLFKKF